MVDRSRRSGSFSPLSDPDGSLHEMSDIYGQTPPRTRHSRRQREHKQRHASSEVKNSSAGKEQRLKSFFCRRNTFDTILFDKMCDQADDEDRAKDSKPDAFSGCSRKCKKSLKLARDCDRSMKHGSHANSDFSHHSEPFTYLRSLNARNMKLWCGVIETRNRFRCLRSKLVNGSERRSDNSTKPAEKSTVFLDPAEIQEAARQEPKSERETFHKTFSFLIRLGSIELENNGHSQMSNEESRWQNELKDLIWLELQAYHADRTPIAQDEYLCKQRDAIGSLLDEIIEYRFDPTSNSADSYLSVNSGFDFSSSRDQFCSGCLSMHCRACSRSQITALKQVENLLCRLEIAESLYPSSQAFAAHFPLYKDPEFVGRMKAMCLWYNMTRHHRLKLRILGKLLMLLDKTKIPSDSDSGINSQSSTSEVDLRTGVNKFDFNLIDRLSENSTPSSSNNSNISSSASAGRSYKNQNSVNWLQTSESSIFYDDYGDNGLDFMDLYLIEFDRQSYRKYIEEVLKTRGLSKSLNFLERLHTCVLRKAGIALKKYEEFDGKNLNEEYEGDWELRRYGMWCPEAQSLNLPSYRASFMFLSRVPLDVIHEFLRMRLEQKPEQPGILSIRQLMREMREGLRIACIHRDRFIEHAKTVMACQNGNCDYAAGIDDISEFDRSLKSVFEVYLDYLQKWMEIMAFNIENKNIIEDEWKFVQTIVNNIENGYQIAYVKFCDITCMMIDQVKDYLNTRPQEISELMEVIDDNDPNTTVKLQLMSVGREYQGMFVEAREKLIKCLTMARILKKDLIEQLEDCDNIEMANAVEKLKVLVISVRESFENVIKEFRIRADEAEENPKNEHDSLAMHTRIREIFHQAYRMGFDYYKETCRLFCTEEERKHLVYPLVSFAMLWMNFVMDKCEIGRGLRPRWANPGLEYLMIVCEPVNTRHLTDDEFEELKAKMDRCISHVVGVAEDSTDSNYYGDQETNSIKRISRTKSSALSPVSLLPSNDRANCHTSGSLTPSRLRDDFQLKSPVNALPGVDNIVVNLIVPECNLVKQQQLLVAIDKLECNLDERRRAAELIGHVTDRKPDVDKIRIKLRRVTFTWQRGIKVGQGRFGKVYTVVNNQTGELLAMKEVSLQPGDHIAIRRVAEELEIFEGINHKHLVRYYGIEIQREEMLIFMEFCAEGTLESFVAGSGSIGLPEIFIRKYTHQLLLAVSILHSHGIVHRDIKTANIFLTDQANCLKLGDFGSAAKIKSHTTMVGELQGFVGTQAYMAPEVFMKTEGSGHGRAADIWSVGCCVIEMASGKRPWSEFDSNYQIMFKVGMGKSPPPPKHLCKEGVDFTSHCLQHDAKKRPTAVSLLSHSFARSYDDINTDLSTRVTA